MAMGSEWDGGFRQRCLIAASDDAQACWEEYTALVHAAAEDLPQEGDATWREELHRARTALITAVTVRRMAFD